MTAQNDSEEDEESMSPSLQHVSSAMRLIREPSKADAQAMEIPFCGCLSVRYYQPYFDIDTADVIARIVSSTFFCKRQELFLQQVGKKADAYGPVWIATTLIFAVAVTSHLSLFLSSWMAGKALQYDFESVVKASSLVYGFALGIPAAIWFLFRQLVEAPYQIHLIQALCLYGYSLFVFIPATVSNHDSHTCAHHCAAFIQ
jgi:hypothetical protein